MEMLHKVTNYTSFLRIEPEIMSMIVIMTTMPSRIMPTLSQFRELRAKMSGVPIPPAPMIPRMVAERTLISNRYKV